MNNERERNNSKFRWLIGAFLLAAVVAGLLRAGRGSTSSVDLWKAEMRARGEAFTVAELLSGHKPSPTNRLADLVRARVVTHEEASRYCRSPASLKAALGM